MKRFISMLTSLGLVFFLTNCSKDLGNYDYLEKNEITVDSILNGDHNSERIYRFVHGDSINIVPQISGTVSGDDLSMFNFLWVIDSDTVARTKDLRITSDLLGFGKKIGNLYITDQSEGVTYNYNMTFEITSSAPRGHFILAENDQGQSRLFVKSTVKPSAVFTVYEAINGMKLGDKPSGLQLIRNSGNSATNYTYSLLTATQGGPTNVIQFLVGDMLPTLLYDKNAMTSGGTEFHPTCLLRSRSMGKACYILNNGKAHILSMGMVGPVLYPEDPLDYNFGENNLIVNIGLYGRYLLGFDQHNSRFRVFGNDWKTPNVFVKNYDHLIDPTLTAGHTFVGGAESIEGGDHYIFSLLTRKENTLYMFKLTYSTSHEPAKFELLASKEMLGLDQLTTAYFNAGSGFWYLAVGRTIYTTSLLGIDLQRVITLPQDGSGNIVDFSFNANDASNFSVLGIATYDPYSTAVHKGSYYVMDVATKQITKTFLNSIDKAKEIQIGL